MCKVCICISFIFQVRDFQWLFILFLMKAFCIKLLPPSPFPLSTFFFSVKELLLEVVAMHELLHMLVILVFNNNIATHLGDHNSSFFWHHSLSLLHCPLFLYEQVFFRIVLSFSFKLFFLKIFFFFLQIFFFLIVH